MWVGLSGLFTLRLGSVISLTGPALSWSAASSSPPRAPSARSNLVTPLLAGANGSNLRKIRPKCCEPVETKRLCAGAAVIGPASDPEMPPLTTTAPAPSPRRFRKPRRP